MLHYELEKKKGSSLYEELYQKLKEDILRGRILPGTKLPSNCLLYTSPSPRDLC